MTNTLTVINEIAWVLGNVLIAYVAIAVIVFVVSYYVLFDPKSTIGGKMIFRFFLSLVGVVGMVFIGTFIDPAGERVWTELPSDIDEWRPVARAVVYGYVSYAITSLAYLLAIKKWFPDKTSSVSEEPLVSVRTHNSEDVY